MRTLAVVGWFTQWFRIAPECEAWGAGVSGGAEQGTDAGVPIAHGCADQGNVARANITRLVTPAHPG